jgi:integrase
MAVRKVKGSWWVEFRWHGERMRKRSPLNTRGGAESYEAHLRQLVAQQGSIEKAEGAMKSAIKPKVPTLDAFCARWLAEYVDLENRPHEQGQKRSILRTHLLPAFGRISLDEITRAAVDRYKIAKRDVGLSAKSINNHLSALHKCLDKAQDWGVITSVPRFSKLPVGPIPFAYLRSDEVEALLATAGDTDLYAMIVAAVRMGLRYSELTALRWSDVNFELEQVHVWRSEVRGALAPPKNGRTRYVPMCAEAVAALGRLPRGQERVFQKGGASFCHATARAELHLLCRLAGIRVVGWHALRHTFASELARRGVALQVIKDLLGHSTLDMTLRYAHVSPELLHAAVARLDPSAPGQPAASRTNADQCSASLQTPEVLQN